MSPRGAIRVGDWTTSSPKERTRRPLTFPLGPWSTRWDAGNRKWLSDRSAEQEGTPVALQEGEQYRCPDPGCGCEVTVTKGAAETDTGEQAPRCCCGHSMEQIA